MPTTRRRRTAVRLIVALGADGVWCLYATGVTDALRADGLTVSWLTLALIGSGAVTLCAGAACALGRRGDGQPGTVVASTAVLGMLGLMILPLPGELARVRRLLAVDGRDPVVAAPGRARDRRALVGRGRPVARAGSVSAGPRRSGRAYQSKERFGRALLGLVVDVHQAEALGVALGPLEVVHQRPACSSRGRRRPRAIAVGDGPQVGVEVVDPRLVVDHAVRVGADVVGAAGLGDV